MEIVVRTPEREIFRSQAAYVSTKAANGSIGILPHHAPMASTLGSSVPVHIRDIQGRNVVLAVHEGFLEVLPTKVTILAKAAELASDIDLERSAQAKLRAERRLKQHEGDRVRAEAALQRALNRLETGKG